MSVRDTTGPIPGICERSGVSFTEVQVFRLHVVKVFVGTDDLACLFVDSSEDRSVEVDVPQTSADRFERDELVAQRVAEEAMLSADLDPTGCVHA